MTTLAERIESKKPPCTFGDEELPDADVSHDWKCHVSHNRYEDYCTPRWECAACGKIDNDRGLPNPSEYDND